MNGLNQGELRELDRLRFLMIMDPKTAKSEAVRWVAQGQSLARRARRRAALRTIKGMFSHQNEEGGEG